MVACNVPASTGSAAAAFWAASRILVQTGSTERGSAAFFATALSIWRSPPARAMVPFSRRADRYASHRKVYVGCTTGAIQRQSTGSPGLQLVDQRLNLAAVVLYVGIEIRTSSHDHADALDLHIGDAQALGALADLPFEL